MVIKIIIKRIAIVKNTCSGRNETDSVYGRIGKAPHPGRR